MDKRLLSKKISLRVLCVFLLASLLLAVLSKGQLLPGILSVLALLFILALTFSRPEEKDFPACHRRVNFAFLLLPSAVLFLLSGIICLILQKKWLLGGAELLIGLGVLVHGVTFRSSKGGHGPIYAILGALSVLRLIVCYRSWIITPEIGSYYRPMFASAFLLLTLCLMMLSTLSFGSRRGEIFSAGMGAFFAAGAIPGSSLSEIFFHLAAAAFLLAELSGLLTVSKKTGERIIPEAREAKEKGLSEPAKKEKGERRESPAAPEDDLPEEPDQ